LLWPLLMLLRRTGPVAVGIAMPDQIAWIGVQGCRGCAQALRGLRRKERDGTTWGDGEGEADGDEGDSGKADSLRGRR
jgi:hypothetical protein